jgi:hypothetical protein
VIELEQSVPIPRTQIGTPKYPFAKMKPGDSFLAPGDRKACINVRNAAVNFGKRHGMRFATRIVRGTGVRVWRVE